LDEGVPGGSPEYRIGSFVVSAVDPKIGLAERRVHKGTMTRSGPIGTGIGAEVTTGFLIVQSKIIAV